MSRPLHILLAVVLTCGLLTVAWQLQKHQDRIIVEHKLMQDDFAQQYGTPPGVAVSNVFFGPFRNLMVNALWLRMERLQKEGKFFEMVQLADWILRVQPENSTVAQYLAWNMAYNITVTLQDYEARRRWIRKGLETLKTAMKYNPNDPVLFREMAWIYQHKLGDELDNAGMYYRQKMAEENFRVFGNVHSPDWDALAAEPADWTALYAADPYFRKICADREEDLEKTFWETGKLPENFIVQDTKKEKLIQFIRGQVIRKELMIEPEHAAWVEKEYGKLDWLLPDPFAIYWGSMGLKKISDPTRTLHCQRAVSQGLKIMMMSGRVVYASGTPGNNFIRIPNFAVADAACEAIKKVAEMIEGGLEFSGYYNFLQEVVELFYLYGQKEKAEKYYALLKEGKPHLTEEKTVQQFVMGRIRDKLVGMRNDQFQSMVSGFILQSIFAFANDADEDAHEMLNTAEMLYNSYRKQHNSEEEQVRLRLPPFKEFKRNVTDMVLKSYPDLSPSVKVKLDLQKNNSSPVEK